MPPTFLPSFLRTLIPGIVGYLLALPVVAETGVTEPQVTMGVTLVLGLVYYAAARLVEEKWPALGGILVGGRPHSAPVAYRAGKPGGPGGEDRPPQHRADDGKTRVTALVFLACTALCVPGLAGAAPAVATSSGARPWAPRYPAPVISPTVVTAADCHGTLLVTFDRARLVGHDWVPILDDGQTSLQLLDGDGRNGPYGAWQDPDDYGLRTLSGGESVLRLPGYDTASYQGAQFALVRVVSGGYTSPGVPIEDRCVA